MPPRLFENLLATLLNASTWHLGCKDTYKRGSSRSRRTPRQTSTERLRVKHSGGKLTDICSPRLASQYSLIRIGSSERLQERTTMSTIESMPEESCDRIISSIINWVCPKCGGHMIEFQCCGRCRRNWLPEWEWANYYAKKSTRNSSSAEQQKIAS